MINKTLNNIFKGDKVIWMVFFFLCIISVIEVYSASSQLTYKDGSYLAPVMKHIGILLMGIFCSFTHDGITLPLCLAFLLLAWQRRAEVMHRACWPMMAGWLIGTVMQFLSRDHLPSLTPDIEGLTSRTALILGLLWDTKVFVLALALTAWFTTTVWGRHELRRAWRRNRLVAYSLFFALTTVPFAPLGIDNAVTGVCFFAMLWSMLLLLGLERQSEAPRVLRERGL